MAIPTPPAAPNPLGTNFAAEALAFTQWMQTAAPEFNTAVGDANQAVLDAQTEGGAAVLAAESARDAAQGHAADSDTARGLAVTAQGLAEDARDAAQGFAVGAEDARDMAQTYAAAAGAAAGLPALAGQALKNLRVKSDETGVEWTAEAAPGSMSRATKTGTYTLVGTDKGALVDCSGTWTLGFTAAATLGAGWWCYVRNVGAEAITLDPNAAEQIDGQATIPLMPGYTLLVQCDGTKLTTLTLKRRTYERRSLITASGTFTVPEDCFVIRAYAFGAGGNPVGGDGGGGGGCAYGDLAVVPGQVVTLGIASGIATVTANAVALLTANPASGATGGTASKHASVTNGGAYSGGTNSAGYAAGSSSGSPLGNGFRGGAYGGAGWGGSGGDTGITASAGGGAAGAASSSANNGGSGFDPVLKPTDPLLADLTGAGGVPSGPGGPGGGGGGGGNTLPGGNGGFGGGGGGTSLASARGGNGGFGGGGGHSGGTSGIGGNGGYGGGGGRGAGTNGAGGPAAIIIIY